MYVTNFKDAQTHLHPAERASEAEEEVGHMAAEAGGVCMLEALVAIRDRDLVGMHKFICDEEQSVHTC